jgi:hypothetical protein
MYLSTAKNLLTATLFSTTITTALAVISTTHTTDIFAWPQTAPSPLPFAKISYSYPSLNATVVSYTASSVAAAAANNEAIRIGVHRGAAGSSEDWVGVSTPATSFDGVKKPLLRVFVDASGEVWHVGVASAGGVADGSLEVQIVALQQGPRVAFDKPIVVNQQGQEEKKEPEKSFFQK